MKIFFKKFIKFISVGILLYFIIALVFPPSFIRNFYNYDWRSKLFIQDSISLDTLDVLILGSSHVSSTFDPRVFSEHKYQSLNLASPSQTPQNSYQILKDFFDGALSKPGSNPLPKVIIHEIYCKTLSDNSILEPYIKYVENYPATYNSLETAFLTENLTAFNMFVSSTLKRAFGIYGEKKSHADAPGYVHFGYYKNQSSRDLLKFPKYNEPVDDITFKSQNDKYMYLKKKNRESYVCNGAPDKTQLDYLKKIINLAKSYSVPVILVIAPMPQDFTSNIRGYVDILSATEQFGKENKVALIYDFGSLKLDDVNSFVDSNHLNNSGAKKVSEFVIEKLESLGFLKKVASKPGID